MTDLIRNLTQKNKSSQNLQEEEDHVKIHNQNLQEEGRSHQNSQEKG